MNSYKNKFIKANAGFILLALILAFSLNSCKKDKSDEELTKLIYGEWVGLYSTPGVKLEWADEWGSAEQTLIFKDDSVDNYDIIRNDTVYLVSQIFYIDNGELYLEHLDILTKIKKLNSRVLKLGDGDKIDGKFRKK